MSDLCNGCSLFQNNWGTKENNTRRHSNGAKPRCKKVKHYHLAGLNAKLHDHGLASLLCHFNWLQLLRWIWSKSSLNTRIHLLITQGGRRVQKRDGDCCYRDQATAQLVAVPSNAIWSLAKCKNCSCNRGCESRSFAATAKVWLPSDGLHMARTGAHHTCASTWKPDLTGLISKVGVCPV